MSGDNPTTESLWQREAHGALPVTCAGCDRNMVLLQFLKDIPHLWRASRWNHQTIYVHSHVFILAPVVPLAAFGQGHNSMKVGTSVNV